MIMASEIATRASTRRPRAGRCSRGCVDMAVSLGRSPKVLPKLEKVSERPATGRLLNAVSGVTVFPDSEKSVERCFTGTTPLQERRARNMLGISAGDYRREEGNTIREIPQIIVR